MAASSSRRGRRVTAALLFAAAILAAAVWWPATPQAPHAPAPIAPPSEAAAAAGSVPRPAPAELGPTLPLVTMAPASAGQDPLVAAVGVARAVAPSAPPSEIAQASSLEAAFAAMRAARGEPSPAAAAASPFGPR